ncbi:MAG: Acetyltransferase protein [Mucilaginibacter sp.]|nr:Acetyltransferase protein [Mucilaginibacter sp.]
MDENNKTELPIVQLQYLHRADPEAFYQVASDPDVVKFFDQFRELSKEQILQTLPIINEHPAYCQYWGIYVDNQALIGFIALKKSHDAFKALEHEKTKLPGYVPDINALAEAIDKPNLTDAREKALSPYTVDIALLKDYRGKGYALAAFKTVAVYCAKAGINELYFEVRPDNTSSLKLMSTVGAELLIPAEIEVWPAIYRLPIKFKPPTTEQVHERLRQLQGTPEVSGYNDWRRMVKDVPELAPHDELMTDLFTAVHAKGVRVEFCIRRPDCHLDRTRYEKVLTVGLANRDDPLSIIWSIAHEYGHACQEFPTENETVLFSQAKYERETDAWNKGEQWLKNKIYYCHNWPSFIHLSHQRLNKYLP